VTDASNLEHLTRKHLRFGWWSLFIFLSLGALLEAFHGFKIGYYLDVSNDARRLSFRLGHAHGTLLSLVHVAFALTLGSRFAPPRRSAERASQLFVAAAFCSAACSPTAAIRARASFSFPWARSRYFSR
jgi:hypothetical protein